MVKSKVTAPRKTSKSKNDLSNRQATELFKKIQKAPAWFSSRDEVWEFNKNIDQMQWIRRIATILLETSGKQLIERVEKERDFAVTMVPWYDRVDDYVKMLEDVKAMMEHAKVRFAMAMAKRPDMSEVFEEGRRPGDGETLEAAFERMGAMKGGAAHEQ